MWRSLLLIGCAGCLFVPGTLEGQALGGATVFNFLRTPFSPQLSALGGVNVSNQTNDLSLAFDQPSLLRDSMHAQMVANFNSFYAGVTDYNWMLAYHHPGLGVNFAVGTAYIDYGSVTQTDASGNVEGDFHPRDYVVQGTVSGKYLERWYYGFTLKYIGSDLGIYRSSGIAMDVGLNYLIADKGWQMGIEALNMGTQFKPYMGADKEPLPFDLEAGVSKRLLKAPFQFSLTLQHIDEWDLLYSDSAFNATVGNTPKDGLGVHLLEHAVFGAQVFASQYIECTLGYNYLVRKELSLVSAPNGLTGFSLGVGLLLPQFTFRYARTSFQNSTGYNQVGLTLPLNAYLSLGKWGKEVGW